MATLELSSATLAADRGYYRRYTVALTDTNSAINVPTEAVERMTWNQYGTQAGDPFTAITAAPADATNKAALSVWPEVTTANSTAFYQKAVSAAAIASCKAGHLFCQLMTAWVVLTGTGGTGARSMTIEIHVWYRS